MLMLEDSDMSQLTNAAQYNVWKGQLYIHEQLVCDIALQATRACSIPSQLPQKLELKEVIQLSELRTKLQEDLFQKTNLTDQEASCGDIYYSLYPVITSNIVGSEFDKLLECLKEQDLALIKVLNDQGFLVLLNSTVFQSSTGICDGNAAQLNALFLFPHTKLLDKREREGWEYKFIRKDLPLTISNLLPGLHYAIIESSKLQKDKALYPGPLVEQYFRKYAGVQRKKDSSSERKPEQTEPLFVCHSNGDLPKKCSQLAFSCLQLYVSSPVNFSVPLIKMSNVLAENTSLPSNSDQCGKTVRILTRQDSPSTASKWPVTARSKADSEMPQGRHAAHEDKQPKRNAKRKNVKRKERQSKRKSPRTALTTAETVKNQTTSKRRLLVSEPKKQIVSSSETTIKLASAPYSQRRKRGAEVLTAAFIQDERMQTTEKLASNKTNEENKNLAQNSKAIKRKPRKILEPEDPFLVPDRPSKRKASDPGKNNMTVAVVKTSEDLKRTKERNDGKTGKAIKGGQEKTRNITVEQINPLSKSSENLSFAKKTPLSVPFSEDHMIEKRINMYESHALNLLADLALNSFGSSNIPYIKIGNAESTNESLVEEAASTGDAVSTVEHSKDCSLPAQSTSGFTEPELICESEKTKNGVNVSSRNTASQKRLEIGEKQLSQKAHIAAAKAKARYNATSKICLEHSYSQLPMEDIPGKSAKEINEQPIQVVPDTTTPADIVPEPSTNGLPGDTPILSSENVCPPTNKKQREVSKVNENIVITFHRETNYDFDLDSKFTSDPVEKTVNRALHGPWNPHLKEKLEDVKIILHMWMALFYSKTNKQKNCNSRKVVEHSNPAKYVSINTVLDPFEFCESKESDGASSTVSTNAIPVGKILEAPWQVNLLEPALFCKSGKSGSKSLRELPVSSSIPRKDYNIKLASEIFQMCQDSESAFYSDSLQTSMTCKMAPTSKGAQTPAYVMKTIYGTSVPTVCYIGDTNLFNTELTDNSENCMDIGGFSSEKAKSKEMEHKYSRDFSSMNKAQKPTVSQIDCKIVSTDVDESEGNVRVGETVTFAGCTSPAHSDIIKLRNVTMSPTTGGIRVTTSKLLSSAESKTVHSPEVVTADGLHKDCTSVASVELSTQNENSKDLGKVNLSVHTRSLLDARMPPGVDDHKVADSHNLLQTSVLLPQDLHDNSAFSDEPDGSDDALQNSEDSDSQMAITDRFRAMGIDGPSAHQDVNTEFCMDKSSHKVDALINEEALKGDSSGICRAGANSLPIAESLDANIHSKSVPSKDCRQVGGLTDVTSDLGQQKTEMKGLELCNSPDPLKNMDSDRNVDYNSNCNEESRTDYVRNSVGFEEKQEKTVENIPDEPVNLTKPKNTHTFDEKVLKEMTATDTMNRLVLSNHSNEASDVECPTKTFTTDHMKSNEKESINKSSKESSEKTKEQVEHSIGENEFNTSKEHSMPVIFRDNSVPEKDNDVQEIDVNETGHISKAGTMDKAEKEVPEKPFLTLNVAQLCLSGGDADLLHIGATDEETKEPEPSHHDVNLNSDNVQGRVPESSKKEVPCLEEKPVRVHSVPSIEESRSGTCLEDGADKYEMDGVPSTSSLGDLNIESSGERCSVMVSDQCEKHEEHVNSKEELAESQNHLLISHASFEGKKITDSTEHVLFVSEDDNLSGSVVKEMQLDAISTETKTQACQSVADNSVNLEFNKVTLEGISDVCASSENTLQSNATSSFSDLLMGKFSQIDSEQPPVENKQPDVTEDACGLSPAVKPTKTNAKDSTRSRNSSSSKKEILSKLKRICLGSITGQQVTSSSENLLFQDKNCINDGFTKEQNEVIDVAKNVLTHEDESTLENCDIAEEPAVDNQSLKELAITTVNSCEPDSLEGVMLLQDDSLMSPSLEDVSDSIEQDPSPELPDICFIVNTGSISKEQYDRWSETSDEDIEYIGSYKEPLSHQEYFQKEIDQSPDIVLNNTKCSQEQTTTNRTKECSRNQPGSNSGLCETDEHLPKPLQDLEYNSIMNQENVTVTRNVKDADRAVQTITKESSSRSDLNHLFSDRRMVSADLTQNTVDMENVRFLCTLKETLRKSSTDKYIYGPPFQTMFESRRVPSCSRSTTKSKSPLLITMRCPSHRTDFRKHDSWHPSTYPSSSYYENELWDRPVPYSRTIRKVRTPRYSPFHFSQLRHENTLGKSNTDISVILNECVQSNHVKLSSIGLSSTTVDRTSASPLPEDSVWQARRKSTPVSSKSQSVKNVISDVCESLHSRLQNVARSSEQKIFFYIYETEDGDFVTSAKSLLVKDGLIPTDPLDFLSSEHCETHQLLVILKNEDVFSCIKKIPYLRQLKLRPNVTFAGVDTPEDMMESTYQELFQAGGFVASDKSVFENITTGKLKEVLGVLEKMNRTSSWKWLIHYREKRKLKENKRAEAVSQTKMSLLKSYQQSNIIEVLPYHQCDSRSKETSDDLSCLLNLQYQHIHSRLAVYLTGTTSMDSEEYEQSGILVYDVDTFLRKIQKVDLQFQASYWS